MLLKNLGAAIALAAALTIPAPPATAQHATASRRSVVQEVGRVTTMPAGITPQYLGTSSTAPVSAAVRAGGVLYLAGALGRDEDGRYPDGIRAQTMAALQRIDTLLTRYGSSRGQVLHCMVILTRLDDVAGMNEAYVAFFPPDRLPARTTFEASRLLAGALVEIQCNATVPQFSGD